MKNKRLNVFFHISLYLICWGVFLHADGGKSISFFIIFMFNAFNYFAALTNMDLYKRVVGVNQEYSKVLDFVISENKKVVELNNRLNEANIALRGGK